MDQATSDKLWEQSQDYIRQQLNTFLKDWIAESAKKDMNSTAALMDIVSRVFTHGVRTGLRLAQKVNRGEM